LPVHTEINSAIEGQSVLGHSRDPLINRGLKRYNNKDCYRFVAAFDVKAKVKDLLREIAMRIEPESFLDIGDEVICEKAFIHSLKNKYSSEIKPASATHKATLWIFPHQTAVKVSIPHEEIRRAIAKRT